jgi:hypothetical protein
MTPDIVSIRKRAENAKKPEAYLHRNHCEHCNAEVNDQRASVREIVLNAICLPLLLAILLPVGYVAGIALCGRSSHALRTLLRFQRSLALRHPKG